MNNNQPQTWFIGSPYSMDSFEASVPHVAVCADENKVVALTGTFGGADMDESMINARLIAAAPELLDALTDALDMLETLEAHGIPTAASGKKAMNKYRTVIAKATGEQA